MRSLKKKLQVILLNQERSEAMAEKERAAIAAAPKISNTNVMNTKDLNKVFEYFRYTVGTTLDCFFATGILRNCITWYVRDLENLGMLQAIYVAPDRRTRFKAKHYSADPAMWAKRPDSQLSLFNAEG